MITKAKASAPAKVILLGEHFVVHGAPAIVLAIDRRATVTGKIRKDKKIWIKSKSLNCSGYFKNGRFYEKKHGEQIKKSLEPIYTIARKVMDIANLDIGVNLEIISTIPVAAGLGSSAAVAVASTAVLNRLFEIRLEKKDIFQIAFDAEKLVHGIPSGIDPAISTYGGILLYQKNREIQKICSEVPLQLIVGNTKMSRSTGEMVAHVKKLKNRYPLIFDSILKAESEIVSLSLEALKNCNLETLGELLNINHALLCALGVSNEFLDKMIYMSRKAGALGAKITGAGGGGCMIALARQGHAQSIVEAITQAGGEAFITNMTTEGVKYE